MRKVALCLVSTLACVSAGFGQLTVPGANGVDGAFVFVGDVGNPNVMTIDLAKAPTGQWDDPVLGGDNDGDAISDGVYDPVRWAVVFRYTSVDVPSGREVRFRNHPSYPPVVWLVSGDVNIAGTINLNGGASTGAAATQSEPGPGGWRGGRAYVSPDSVGSAGFGPGGGKYELPSVVRNAGGYATPGSNQPEGPLYGNASLIPLYGGSGGSASNTSSGGFHGAGAGGGAILIASAGTITVGGAIRANGGAGSNADCSGTGAERHAGNGSGGGIRLVADEFLLMGSISAAGASGCTRGGSGRIRIEANLSSTEGSTDPVASFASPQATAILWPGQSAPSIEVVEIDTGNGMLEVPSDPQPSKWDFPEADVSVDTLEPITLNIFCRNVPVPTDAEPWEVAVRVIAKSGPAQELQATFVPGGSFTESEWRCSFVAPQGYSAIQARAFRP